MGSDDLFKNRKEARKKKDSEFRQLRANSFPNATVDIKIIKII